MAIKDQLMQDLKEAMKNKEDVRKSVITLIRAAVKQREVDERVELSEEQVQDIIAKQLKQRRDSLEEFKKAGREDLIEQTQKEIDIITTYLPAQLSIEEIETLVDEAIAETGATSVKDMGKIMSVLNPKTKGRADGKVVNEVVRKKLQ